MLLIAIVYIFIVVPSLHSMDDVNGQTLLTDKHLANIEIKAPRIEETEFDFANLLDEKDTLPAGICGMYFTNHNHRICVRYSGGMCQIRNVDQDTPIIPEPDESSKPTRVAIASNGDVGLLTTNDKDKSWIKVYHHRNNEFVNVFNAALCCSVYDLVCAEHEDKIRLLCAAHDGIHLMEWSKDIPLSALTAIPLKVPLVRAIISCKGNAILYAQPMAYNKINIMQRNISWQDQCIQHARLTIPEPINKGYNPHSAGITYAHTTVGPSIIVGFDHYLWRIDHNKHDKKVKDTLPFCTLSSQDKIIALAQLHSDYCAAATKDRIFMFNVTSDSGNVVRSFLLKRIDAIEYVYYHPTDSKLYITARRGSVSTTGACSLIPYFKRSHHYSRIVPNQ